MAELIQAERRADGVYRTGPWPAEVLIADEFLCNADPECVHQADGRVIFTLRNGYAEYEIVGYDPTTMAQRAELRSGR